MGCLQFAVGTMYACILWLLGLRRPIPHAVEVKAIMKLWIRRCNPVSEDHSYSFLDNSDTVSTTEPQSNPRWRDTSTEPLTHPCLRDTSHVAIYHTLGQLCTVLSLSLNSIGFAHVIKAMEPFFSSIASRIYLGKKMNIRVYLSLIPVVGGVIMAVAGSDEFSWLAFAFGMGSNVFFALRAVMSKLAMDPPKRNNEDEQNSNNKPAAVSTTTMIDSKLNSTIQAAAMSPSNFFAAVTCVSFVFSIPLALIFEGKILTDVIKCEVASDATTGSPDMKKTFVYIISSGLFHFLNNEVMYMVLNSVHPVTLAVGNTLKRVFIIISGVIVFSTPITCQTAIGSVIGIGGVGVYSLMKQWYDIDHKNKDRTESEREMLFTELVKTTSAGDTSSEQHLVSRKHNINV